MTTTLRLFDKDAYLQEFEAQVISCKEGEKGYEIILDQTAFFPEEGGQTSDTGTLFADKEIRVTDVQIREDVITHITDGPIPEGTKVTGRIDFEARYDKMQQHSGEHIFSGTVHRLFHYDNVGFHLSDSVVTMDFNGPLTPDEVTQIEDEVNRVIWEDVPIKTWYPEKEELDQLDYRSKKELTGAVRLVKIGPYDLCACCAPHVHTTGEIGLCKVVQLQNYKGGVRITICCGKRSLTDYRIKQDSVNAISNQLSAKPAEVSEACARILEECGIWKQRYNQLLGKLLSLEIEKLPADAENVLLWEETFDPVVSRNAVNEMMARFSGYCGLFCGNSVEGYRFIIGSAKEDCSALAGRIREIGGKGGGSKEMIQGSLKVDKETIEKLLNIRPKI